MLITGCASPASVSMQAQEPDYWPTSGWKSSTPEAQGMDSALLAQMIEEISLNETSIHSVLVVRNGYMVTEAYFHPYTPDTKVHVQSVTKSVIGMLVGIALRKGILTDVEQHVLDFFRNRRVAYLSEAKESVQLKHLLSMTSGFDCQEFSSGPRMEQTADRIQFMLDLCHLNQRIRRHVRSFPLPPQFTNRLDDLETRILADRLTTVFDRAEDILLQQIRHLVLSDETF